MNYTKASTAELTSTLCLLQKQYSDFCSQHLTLNMARGKPAPSQLDLSNPLLEPPMSFLLEDGDDARNYGCLKGIPECRRLLGETLGIEPDQIILGGNSSLNMMFDTLSLLCLFGTDGGHPWMYHRFCGAPIRFLCPSPGYDRHFRICEEFGIEMIPVPLLSDGPDMDIVRHLVASDPLIKGIWCVPLHSNPQGVCYSDRIVTELASMETAADDFRIFWDNAYGIHHLYEQVPLKNILDECRRHGHPNRTYYFFSTSKITFPGGGVALTASSPGNVKELLSHMSAQTIGHDKLNQLRHVQFFRSPEGILRHMDLLSAQLRPKFDLVLSTLDQKLGGTQLASWSRPLGGYFVSLDTFPGCAKRTVELASAAGVTMTPAGATFPYGVDPLDRNIRIAPSFPDLPDLALAMNVFTVCVKIAGIEKLLDDRKGA